MAQQASPQSNFTDARKFNLPVRASAVSAQHGALYKILPYAAVPIRVFLLCRMFITTFYKIKNPSVNMNTRTGADDRT